MGLDSAIATVFALTGPNNILLGIASKNDQAPNIIVNLINNPHVRAADLGPEADIIRNIREILEPQGIEVNIRSVRVLDQ